MKRNKDSLQYGQILFELEDLLVWPGLSVVEDLVNVVQSAFKLLILRVEVRQIGLMRSKTGVRVERLDLQAVKLSLYQW